MRIFFLKLLHLVREASKQVLGERHFDVQLAEEFFCIKGCVAEMKTGEGRH